MSTINHVITPFAPDAAEAVCECRIGEYLFKLAETDDEFSQLHRMNYRTFAEEISQHHADGSGQLVDKFHDKNRYFIAKRGEAIIAMIAVHDQPPFSVADKMQDPAPLKALGDRLLEVRLLAVDQAHRRSTVFGGLVWVMSDFALRQKYSHMVISGVETQIELYTKLGFKPLGPMVKSGDAQFMPMVMDMSSEESAVVQDYQRWLTRLSKRDGLRLRRLHLSSNHASTEPTHLIPGPVQLSSRVKKAMNRPAVYHRCESFREVYQRVRQTLSRLVGGGKSAALFCGSGTLGNDVVAATLAAKPDMKQGIVLVNGEFGRRLAEQADRVGLQFEVIESEWGQPWDMDRLAKRIAQGDVDWVWGVHLETSTGMVNRLAELKEILASYGTAICLDCVSSLGALPVDLQGVMMATGTSGKSLGAKAGLSMVFVDPDDLLDVQAARVPNYLDLRATLLIDGPRFTCSSQDLLALDAALEDYTSPEASKQRFDHYEALAGYVRQRLRQIGLPAMVDGVDAAPVVITIQPPQGVDAMELVNISRQWGYLIGGESGYLREKNWIQLSTMGDLTRDDCEGWLSSLAKWKR